MGRNCPSKKMRLLTVSFMLTFSFLAVFLFSPKLASAAVDRYTNTDYLNIDSPMIVEFSELIQFNSAVITIPTNTASTAFTGISLYNVSTATPVAVPITLALDGRKLKVIPNPKLERNSDYRLEISDHVVEKINGTTILPVTSNGTVNLNYPFATNSLSFRSLMVGTNNEITRLIREYTLRQMLIKAPERYVEQVDIIHKRREIVQGQATESVTNIDISVRDHALYNTNGDISKIVVFARAGNVQLRREELNNLNLSNNSGVKLYDFSFTQLPDTRAFDIEIFLYDNDDKVIDSRLIKIPLDSNTITTIRQRDRYRMAGRTFTFHELLTKPRDFQVLLEENRLDEITVQVEER